jgi:hypothetical protein
MGDEFRLAHHPSTVYEVGLRVVKSEIERCKENLNRIENDIQNLERTREIQKQILAEYLLMLELDEKETT